jgi:hypothetical protein
VKALRQMDTTFVVGTATFRIAHGSNAADRYMSVTITRDDRVQWTYRQASWRPLAVGYGHGSAYVWSARDVVVLPADHDGDPGTFTVDEDLLFVFKIKDGWLLVCETSVRLMAGQVEQSRVEFSDVIERADWDDKQLRIEDARGISASITIADGRLANSAS